MEPVRASFVCPRCGLALLLLTEPPSHGVFTCQDCEAEIPFHPPTHLELDGFRFAGAAALEEGAEHVRRLVERIKRGE